MMISFESLSPIQDIVSFFLLQAVATKVKNEDREEQKNGNKGLAIAYFTFFHVAYLETVVVHIAIQFYNTNIFD